jgi:hypothetical protein
MSNGRVALLDRRRRKRAGVITAVAVGAIAAALTGAGPAQAHDIGRGHDAYFEPGNLLVSRTVYQTNPGVITPGVTVLPPGCTTACAVATSDPATRACGTTRLAGQALRGVSLTPRSGDDRR